eukprot:TRINITY_DN54102_c0_g1_i1.p1 TRINITY_DN54102_c0_g1~~TRINITY_DN54102_c0_g1_i1.p1  ORF type:complete len:133 (+),score=0.77 TRINITY_DN54102_c0_g1_i1:2-400(+)
MIFGSKKDAKKPEHRPTKPEGVPFNDKLSNREQTQVDILKTLLNSYSTIVRKNVQDMVTKIVWRGLVEKSKSELQKELVAKLYKDELYTELLKESPHIAQRRTALAAKQKVLREAKEIIQLAELNELSKHDW